MLPSRLKMKSGLTAILAGVLAAAFLLASAGAPARAAEDDDEAFDQKIFRNLLEGIGLRKDGAGIEYRERSPLVVPPSRSLPPPDTGAAVETNPAWPVDPDIKRRKDAKAAAAKTQYFTSDQIEADSRPLKPDQMRKGALPRNQQIDVKATTAEESGRPMKPSALGYKGGFFGSLLGSNQEEYATFTAEPPRSNLTEPPPGYQTPSPNQPYGLKQSAEKPKAFDIKEKGIDNK
jgi:hypothetical protein